MIIKEIDNTGYFVTSDGNVFKKNKKGIIFPLTTRNYEGKNVVALRIDGRISNYCVDSLMIRTFYNLKNKRRYTVKHINGVNTDDTLINLSIKGLSYKFDEIVNESKKCLKSPENNEELKEEIRIKNNTINYLLEESKELEFKIKNYERDIEMYEKLINKLKYQGILGKLRKRHEEKKLAKLIEREIKNENNK